MADLTQLFPGMTVATPHAARFKGLFDDLEAAGYGVDRSQSGGYAYRNIAGTNKLSNHAHGNAVDINWTRNPRGAAGDIPPDLARSLAQKHGLTWGGDWKNPDPMHFEVAGLSPSHATNSPVSQTTSYPTTFQPGAQPMADNEGWSLSKAMSNPMFQGGLGLFLAASQGGDLNAGLNSGVQRASALTEAERNRKLEAAFAQPGALEGIDPTIANVARLLGPAQGGNLIAQALLQKQKMQNPMHEYGKAGTIVQGPDGTFYSVQFGSNGQKIVAPLEYNGKGLSPAKGVQVVGDTIIHSSTGQDVRNVAPNIAGAAAAREVGEAKGKAQVDAPRLEDNAASMLDTINKAQIHPGRYWGTGPVAGRMPAIGGDQAGFVALMDQIQGKTFLEAFNSLRGGGQITEVEGTKATNAIARLNRVQNDRDFDDAMKDLREVVTVALARARRAAQPVNPQGQSAAQPAPAAPPPAASQQSETGLPPGWSIKRVQ